MKIRQGTSVDFPNISALWRRSVEATHSFLSKTDMDAIHAELEPVFFPAVSLWVAEENGEIAGFMGMDENRVEMLFVEPQRCGQGVGTRLLDFAREKSPLLFVDVNEQNPAARGFYERYGFRKTGRSELDGQGRPFPLIHMAFEPQKND